MPVFPPRSPPLAPRAFPCLRPRDRSIRLFAVKNYGMLIHEFDPWFNFRATQYLADHGTEKFFKWFDYMSWYPLGRPVGTTIYPGMQFSAVYIWRALNEYLGVEMSLNDVCVMVPAWFGAVATALLGLLTAECSGSGWAGAAASLVMAVAPAHIMRSVAGGFDNESVAITAMCLTFLTWNRAIRDERSWPFGVAAGLAYVYMVWVWGGYVFVLNMVGLHAAFLALTGHFSMGLWKAYSLWYVIGTYGAIQLPVVGLRPLKSLEELAPMGVFFMLHLLAYCEWQRGKKNLSSSEHKALIFRAFAGAGAVGAVGVAILYPTGYFGPLSARVAGLFVKHTRTGNPLVDSVAEHQPASADAYWAHLHMLCYFAPAGFVLSLFRLTRANYFLVLYGLTAYYFANRMNRLIILMGPIASALSGVAIGKGNCWAVDQFIALVRFLVSGGKVAGPKEGGKVGGDAKESKDTKGNKSTPSKSSKSKKQAAVVSEDDSLADTFRVMRKQLGKPLESVYYSKPGVLGRAALAAWIVYATVTYLASFWAYSHRFAAQISQPSIIFKGRLQDGKEIMVTDYLDGYNWLRENTPEDARVMSWWDYGYQITGIGNRTTLADGNTWNHEHIALLGRALTSPERQAHKIVRHLADYVLVWAGGGGDDLAKSPHMARIGTSVFPDICPNDPLCKGFGFYDRQQTPTPSMAASLLYKLTQHKVRPGVEANSTLFKEVWNSRYGKMRIFKVLRVSKESKEWLADPANRLCDAPGSWYCPGQYPPKLPGPPKSFKKLDYDEAQKAQPFMGTRE